MYKIKSFFTRLKRAINWGIFIFKQPKWQEYESFVEIMEKRLLNMAQEFEIKDITVSAAHNAKRMRLAAKLLNRFRTEYYQTQYQGEHWVEDKVSKYFSLSTKEFQGGFDSTYNSVDSYKASKKDEKALRIGMLIISRSLPRWWM